MRKLILALMLLATNAFAFPEHSNTTGVNIDKIVGNWDSFNWKWAGYNSQTNSMVISNASAGINLTGYSVITKISRYSETGLVTYLAVTNAVISNSNVAWYVAYSNIPPNGTYLCEGLAYDSAVTSMTRTVWQGKITVFDSIYGDDDGQYPFVYNTNLLGYLTIAQAATSYVSSVTAGTGLSGGGSGSPTVSLSVASIASLALADTALQPASTQGLVTASITNNVASSLSAHQNLTGASVHGLGSASTNQSTDFARLAGYNTFTSSNLFSGVTYLGSDIFYTPSSYAWSWQTGPSTLEILADFDERKLVDGGVAKIWRSTGAATNGEEIVNYQTLTNKVESYGYLLPASTQGLITAIGTLQTSNELHTAWEGSVSGRVSTAEGQISSLQSSNGVYATTSGTSSGLVANATAAGNLNMAGYSVTNALQIQLVSNSTVFAAGAINGTNAVRFTHSGTNFWILLN